MLKKNALRQATAWTPETTLLEPAGSNRLECANDEAFMPPLPPTPAQRVGSFGGRQHRYLVQRQQQLRIYDPISQRFVTFAHERYLHAWLLMRFNSSVTELDEQPAAVAYQRLGRRFAATPHLSWRSVRSGRRVLFWLRQEWTDDDWRAYAPFAGTHSVEVQLGTWADLEEMSVRLDNLQMGRQQMTMVQHAGLDIRVIARGILRHLREHNGRASRGELGAELCAEECLDCDAQVDAALFHLYAVGRVYLDIGSTAFGDDTHVRHA